MIDIVELKKRMTVRINELSLCTTIIESVDFSQGHEVSHCLCLHFPDDEDGIVLAIPVDDAIKILENSNNFEESFENICVYFAEMILNEARTGAARQKIRDSFR